MFAVTDLNKTSHIQGHLQKTNQKDDGWMNLQKGLELYRFYDQDNGVHTINAFTIQSDSIIHEKIETNLEGFFQKEAILFE
ncbi:hypothetical protein PVL29_002759 [Vitis rotundifolia]|uniref:Uncharacterized protein n=1 Tax=Vitis rotundifolia TaxID=103349 RepID=A0AA39E219_VITRO|nr:hypothetical protein PVL29_002759 [Vitis rotundifolia]